MSKNKTKKGYDAMRALVVKKLSAKYDVTETFVRDCLIVNSRQKSERADLIRKEFCGLYKELTQVLN